jgi:hypothetical protein
VKNLILFFILFLPSLGFSESKIINDELVRNLSCSSKITESVVLKAIDTAKAFDLSKVLPVRNWGFTHNNLYELGACWSMSHFARQVFYLGRNSEVISQNQKAQILNSARGSAPKETLSGVRFERSLALSLIPQNSNDLASLYQEKFVQTLPSGQKITRNLKSDLEAYQSYRFHLPENAGLIGGDRERPRADNVNTIEKLKANLPANKLTLLVLRAARNMQHVIVAKSILLLPNGSFEVLVYDSNSPFQNQILSFDQESKQFYAPEILRLFRAPNPQSPVGVFIVDEGDRDRQLKFLAHHYQTLCGT